MKDRKKSLGKLIQVLRLARGLKQEVLGKAASISQSKICRIERGDGEPTFFEMVDMADVLGQPLETFRAEKGGGFSFTVRAD